MTVEILDRDKTDPRRDSMAVEFFYMTDTCEMGTVTYSMEGQELTGLGSMSYAKANVRG